MDIQVRKKGGWGMIDVTGKEVIPTQYNEIEDMEPVR